MKGKAVNFFISALGIIAGIAVGLCIARSIDFKEISAGDFMVQYVLKMAVAALAFYLTTVIHEAGHLVFGLLTGYQFISFRIGPLMLMKENGRFVFRKLTVAGTGGQCLLKPPVMKDGLYPFKLYHLGGAMMNLIAAVVFLLLSLLLSSDSLVKLFCQLMVIVNVYTALVNGIPLMTTVANDGYNVMTLSRNPEGLARVWRQLMINSELAQGKDLVDMDSSLFVKPETIDDVNTATEAVVWENLLMYQHRFDEVLQLCDQLIDNDKVLPLYRYLMICDKIYCQCLQGAPDVSLLQDKEVSRFLAQMKTNLCVIRTNYALAVKADNDPAKAGKYADLFEKTAEKHPYRGEVEAERALISLIK